VFTARYALSPYIKQIRFIFKGLSTIVDSASPCLEGLSTLNASVSCLWIFTLPFESWNIILIKFTNLFGIRNSCKISRNCVIFIELCACFKSLNNECKLRLNLYNFSRMHLNIIKLSKLIVLSWNDTDNILKFRLHTGPAVHAEY
jgi:hypothetical protein